MVVAGGTLLFNRLFGTDAMLRNAAETENVLPADVEVAAVVATSTGDVGRTRAARDSTDDGNKEAIPVVAAVVEGMKGGDFAR